MSQRPLITRRHHVFAHVKQVSFAPTAGCVDVQYIVLIVNTSCGFRMIDNWF